MGNRKTKPGADHPDALTTMSHVRFMIEYTLASTHIFLYNHSPEQSNFL
jgi:hypothetical protein